MNRILLVVAACTLFSSCATMTLYDWGGTGMRNASAYEQLTYKNYDKRTPESLCDLLCLYEKMVTRPGGTRQMPPPGICAEYGYMLLQPRTAETFLKQASSAQMALFKGRDIESYFHERGTEMLEKEIALYPESVVFIQPLLKKLSGK